MRETAHEPGALWAGNYALQGWRVVMVFFSCMKGMRLQDENELS